MKRADELPQAVSAQLRHVILGTAGHIDHGKTTLVRALTGVDTDRLPEEKQRGITIDLGFAELQLPDKHGGVLHLSLIDVPGHHAFIRNMLAGAGGIDCVLLVIAADEGVKAQTAEHLAICELLGIERGIIALTKSDAVSSDHLRETMQQVRRFVEHTFLRDAAVVPVSAVRGDGIDLLKRALAQMAAEVPPRSSREVLRLPLDRSFTMRGFGTVVTGTLQSGVIHAGDTLEQKPGGRLVRVRSLQVHGRQRDHAEAPCRVALNIPGVEVGQIGRGETLTLPETLTPTSVVDVQLTMQPDAPALRHGSRIHMHAFTAETVARILLFDQKDSRTAGSGFARLKLAEPMLLVPGDRLVLRECSPAMTIGGARVIDSAPEAGMRKAASVAWLRKLAVANAKQKLLLRIDRRGAAGMAIADLRRETGLTIETLRSELAAVIDAGSVFELPGRQSFVSSDGLAGAARRAEEEMAREGTLSRAELRSRRGLNADVFELVVDRLLGSGRFEASGEALRPAGEAIPGHKRIQMDEIEKIYSEAGLAPPLLSDVTRRVGLSQSAMREVVTLLLRSKRLMRLGADQALVHPSALENLYGKMRAHRGETFDVGRFKALTGLTRKHAIPLLEHLDQARITRNDGGTRVVL